MSEQSTEPDVVELQHTAQAAKEALTSSLARLDDRVKQLRSTALDATAASGWGIAAACAWWLSVAIHRPRVAPVHRPALASVMLTTALKTASFVLTGVLVYASYRHVRRLGTSSTATEAGPLPAREARFSA